VKRASYWEGVEYIACNDNPGDDEPADVLAGYISVVMLAVPFKVERERVAADVAKFRKAHPEVTGR